MVRELFPDGEFLEVFVDTPLDACIERDPKGLYQKALDGQIANFTGVSSPYEAPELAELVLKTTSMSPDEAAEQVIAELTRRGLI
jgi:bifunctional enzyme CysN/CysC